MDLNIHHSNPSLETPDSFCHFNLDAENVERYDEETLPKTLVCHDMANGYHDDSYIDGTGQHDAYTFYNWAGIDIFCYFSHHLITIPPLGWINVGHAHGVKVIGTVITEWAEGIVFWDKILDSETEYLNFASALVAIAKTLKFDGWLLNIENKISKPEVLLNFVKHLHHILHQEIPHAELIWYDSVTIQGTLNWQNGLNEKNKAFFDACDGLFTNYSWNENDVRDSAIEAGDRVRDLYIGIDVWGRNFYGGGLFNTQAAVKVAFEYECSLAIFAPAWTHEALEVKNMSDVDAMQRPGRGGGDRMQEFLLRDRALWGSLWPFLFTRLPCHLPFGTSFCRGQGKRRRHLGEVISPQPWYNLRHQQYQPSAAHGPHGYMLTSVDQIAHMTRLRTVKDKAGILKYRESFLEHRHELLSSTSRQTLAMQDAAESRGGPSAMQDVREEDDVEDDEGREAADDEPRSMKRKVKKAVQQLFRIKSPRTSDVAEAPEGSQASELAPGGSGKSMLRVSVQLALGQSSERRLRFALEPVAEERECLELYRDDSFGGGSCLRVNPTDVVCDEHRTIRLFLGDWNVERAVVVCVVTKHQPGYSRQSLNVRLAMRTSTGAALTAVLVGRTMPGAMPAVAPATGGIMTAYPLVPETASFRAMQRDLLLNNPAFYVPIENPYEWQVRYFEVVAPGATITAVNLRTELPQGPVLLGHFGLCSKGLVENDE